ncbi:hypothetical protein psal_cds_36 [Pandoravirus salinus]|uniref:Uncharacterized protein n=1 Tax=Pandoravirus salinus TaxID=1349410 RepID=S4VZE9_9VIRU|nr:hypothetical protein psal_cds_36 [Pandoravirus salinus]AGO83412.1 hypothetical protein psal_cds_36 [Pandoravirus salinus]
MRKGALTRKGVACDGGTTLQRYFVDDAVCRLYLLCRRARAGDADATELLAPYLAAFPTHCPQAPRQDGAPLPHPARLARYYRHCWTASIDVMGTPGATADAGETQCRVPIAPRGDSTRIANATTATEQPARETVTPKTAAGDDDGGRACSDDLDGRGWTFYMMVGHGAAENDIVLFGLDRRGRVRYETGYYVIPHGQDPDPIGGRSAGQRLGHAGRQRMPPAISAHASALPSLLQAAASASCGVQQLDSARGEREPPLDGPLSFPQLNGINKDADDADRTERRPVGDAADGDSIDVCGCGRDVRHVKRRIETMLGAASLRSTLAPLRRAADLPPTIAAYVSENEPDADRLWLGGRPVSAASLAGRQMALALRLYSGHMAGRRASRLFGRPPTLAGMAARACAIASVPLDRRRAPAEALALVGAHIWCLVCADDPLATGRLSGATRLLDAARALDVTPTTAELRLPELLCGTLATPALSYATPGQTCPPLDVAAATPAKDAL